MFIIIFRRSIAVFSLLCVSSVFAGNSSYIENTSKGTGKLTVPKFNFSGQGIFSVSMSSVSGEFLLEPGLRLKVTKIKPVKSATEFPSSYNPDTKKLSLPSLVMKSKSKWVYYNVILAPAEAGEDNLGFPLEFLVESVKDVRIDDPEQKDMCVLVDPGDPFESNYYYKWHANGSLKAIGGIISLIGIRVQGFDSSLVFSTPFNATAVVRPDGKINIFYDFSNIKGLDDKLTGTANGNVYSAMDCNNFTAY